MTTDINPAGPIPAARHWLNATMRDRDLRAAWPLTDPPLREAWARQWIADVATDPALPGLTPERADAEREALAAVPPTSDLWDVFSGFALLFLERLWPWRQAGGDWGWVSETRPISPDYELALYVDRSRRNDAFVNFLPAVKLLMHETGEGWLVAGFDETLPPE